MTYTHAEKESTTSSQLKFLWLELTERCNLHCIHCYADSHPRLPLERQMTQTRWERVIEEARLLGCEGVQFIGGEVLLVPYLSDLIRFARSSDIPTVEVFTNATLIDDDLIELFREKRVSIATSFYCSDPLIHDQITSRPGSWQKTVDAIDLLQKSDIQIRVGVIAMQANEAMVPETLHFLEQRGVKRVGVDRARSFGRSVSLTERESSPAELCGNCGNRRACIASTGEVFPCIMSREDPIGNVMLESLENILSTDKLKSFRAKMISAKSTINTPANRLSITHNAKDECSPDYCNPDFCCGPNESDPDCSPSD